MEIKDPEKFFESKTFTKILWGIAIVFAAIVIFNAGIFVGYKKAAFSYGSGDNYYRAFGPKMMGGFGMNPDDRGPFQELSNAHGSTGQIIKINLPSLMIEDDDQTEKVIVLNNNTKIRSLRQEISPADLKTGDFAIIIGTPNSKSEIEASFIRILPPPPDFLDASSTTK